MSGNLEGIQTESSACQTPLSASPRPWGLQLGTKISQPPGHVNVLLLSSCTLALQQPPFILPRPPFILLMMNTTSATRRIFVSVSSKSPHFAAAWEDPQVVVQAALDLLKESNTISSPPDAAPNPRLLLVERWCRIHLVFDIFHEAYDPEDAHLPGRYDLATIAVFFLQKDKTSIRYATAAESKLRREVNEQVRDFHNLTGTGSQPPFFIDHANGNVPTFWNPRIPGKLPEEPSEHFPGVPSVQGRA